MNITFARFERNESFAPAAAMRSSFRIASILFIVAAGAVPSIEAADNREGEIATTLTVRWPAPLSKNLTESAVIEGFLDKFLVRN